MQVNNKTKTLLLFFYLMFFLIVFAFVYLINMYFTNITEWWILALTSTNIILLILTESFIMDDSTGGYKNILDSIHLGILILIISLIIIIKTYSDSVSNRTLFIFFLLFNLTSIFIKYIVKQYLSKTKIETQIILRQ